MNAILYWAASFALVCFALGMVFAAIRLLRGPTAQDRVLALDTLYINGMPVSYTHLDVYKRQVLVSATMDF